MLGMKATSRIALTIALLQVFMLQGCGFIDDLKTQSVQTQVVTVDRPVEQADANSSQPEVSADGRFVVFTSDATNLVNEQSIGARSVFLKDTVTGETMRVSTGSGGGAADDDSESASISADGRYIAFQSAATNLSADIPGSSGCTSAAGLDVSCSHIYIKDTETDTTVLASKNSDGAAADGNNERTAISADGRYVAFRSTATNLDAAANGKPQIYLRDMQTGFTRLVSADADGSAGNDASDLPAISDDGRFVAFKSLASNLASGDDIGSDVFLKDMETGALTLASTDSGGGPGNGASGYDALDISADGRFVAFESEATNLAAGDDNGKRDIFIKDMQTGETGIVSTDAAGVVGDDDSFASVSLSGDGMLVVIGSNANNLVPGDTVNKADVFLKDRSSGAIALLSTSEAGEPGNGASEVIVIAAGGARTVFVSAAGNLVVDDTNGKDDIFVREMATGAVRRASTSSSPQDTRFFDR